MTTESQRVLERAYYNNFIQHCPLAPKGNVEYSDKPDVLVRNTDLLGIEIANIYHNHGKEVSSEQIQSRRRSSVIKKAHALYQSSENPQFEFWLDFDPSFPITDINEVAHRVNACALQAIKQNDEYSAFKGFSECPELRFLYHDGNEYKNPNWKSIQSYHIPPLNPQRVIDIVISKDQKVKNYRKCDRYWLLLIVDFWDPAQDQNLIWASDTRIGATSFDRIIIFKPATHEWLDISQ